MNKNKVCVFDLDGTLINTLTSIAGFANGALLKRGYEPLPENDYCYLVGNGADTLMRGMLKKTAGSYTEEDVTELRRVYDELYESNPMKDLKEYPGVKEAVACLHQNGFQLAVLSNKPDSATQAIIRLFFPAGTFAIVYGQRSDIPKKPSPEGALQIASRLGVNPKECFYIGDTDVDMKTGNAAGMKTIGVLWGFRDRKELEENHAAYIVSSPEEMLQIIL